MPDSAYSVNRNLSHRISRLLQDQTHPDVSIRGALRDDTAIRVVITANEVNDRHGTGPLVQRICGNWTNLVSIRAKNDWGGVQDFGDWHVCLHQRARSRRDCFEQVLRILNGRRIESILCVPFLPEDLLTAIAVQKSFGAKLCAYIMDDQNVVGRAIPDDLMREFLECCALRLVTHPELQFAYERKFELPFHILPAIVPDQLIARESTAVPQGRRGALLGSFWEQRSFDLLCAALEPSQCEIDWFGNNRSPWVRFDAEKMRAARIRAHGVIPEDRLAEVLKTYSFVIVPVAPLDGAEASPGVARLSLPGRILFTVAASQTPVLVVGSAATCGARFVKHFSVGDAVPYDARRIAAAIDRLSTPEEQRRLRQSAMRIGPALSDGGVGDWVASSLELGRPADARFNDLFSGYDGAIEVDGTRRKAAWG